MWIWIGPWGLFFWFQSVTIAAIAAIAAIGSSWNGGNELEGLEFIKHDYYMSMIWCIDVNYMSWNCLTLNVWGTRRKKKKKKRKKVHPRLLEQYTLKK